MKQFFLTLTVVAALGACGADASITISAAKPQLRFSELRSAAIPAAKAATIRSMDLVYKVSGQMQGYLRIRAKKEGLLRLDVIDNVNKADSYAVGRNGSGDMWSYTRQDGAAKLEEADAKELMQDAALLPIFFLKDEAFLPPEQLPDETVDGVSYRCYSTASALNPSLTLKLMADKKTGYLHRIIANGEEGVVETTFSDYRDIDGIMMATKIRTTDPSGSSTMTLHSIKWNPATLVETVFNRPAKPVVHEQIGKPAPAVAAAARKSTKLSPQEREKLEKKVRDLTVQIGAAEKALELMEKTYASNTDNQVQLAKTSTSRRRYYSCWSGRSYYTTNNSRHRRQLYNRLKKQNSTLSKDYVKLSKRLIKMRQQLGDAQAQLEK